MQDAVVRARSTWLDVVSHVLARLDEPLPWSVVCTELGEQLDSPVRGDFRWTRAGTATVTAYPFPDGYDLQAVAGHAPGLHPLALQYAATGTTAVLRMDRTTATGLGPATRAYCHELRDREIECHLWVPVDQGPEESLVIGVCRPVDAYTDLEVTLARTAQTVVSTLHRHCETLARLRRDTAGPELGADACADLHLTPRQVAVLSLLAEGLTATAIGRRLRCSPRTVERHVQNSYARLGVHDRVSAVLRLQQIGLLRTG